MEPWRVPGTLNTYPKSYPAMSLKRSMNTGAPQLKSGKDGGAWQRERRPCDHFHGPTAAQVCHRGEMAREVLMKTNPMLVWVDLQFGISLLPTVLGGVQ
jgi:hypothetical protein